MAAPTPVSAYLHAASMVKAGVYLVARLAPGFADAARLVGARRRARPGDDGRRRLARDGAVRPQAAARVRHRQPARVPHGPVRRGHPDRGHRRHRDAARTRLLQGAALPRRPASSTTRPAPGTCASCRDCGRRCAAARSPPARRRPRWPGCRRCSASSARRPGSRRSSLRTTCAAGSSPSQLVAGSVFTVAYSARFLWGAFGRKPGVADTPVHRPGPLLSWPAGLCALGGLVLGIANPVVDVDAQSYAAAYPATSPVEASYHLALWHGLGLPLLASAVALVLGYALHRAWSTVGRLAGRLPRALSAQHAYELAVGGTERVATAVTGRLQVGSVPTYLTVILVTVVALPGHGRAGRRLVAGPARLPRAAAAAAGRAGDARGARPGAGCAAGSPRCCSSGWSATASAACSSSTVPPISRSRSSSSRRCRWSRSCSSCAGCPRRFTQERPRARVQVPKAVIAAVAGGDGRRDGGRAQRRPPGTADDQRRVHPARPGGRGRDERRSARSSSTSGRWTPSARSPCCSSPRSGSRASSSRRPTTADAGVEAAAPGARPHEEEVAGADPAEEPVAVPTGLASESAPQRLRAESSSPGPAERSEAER